MPALKNLRGVAHDLAHHSQSSLSWLHPHLAQVCREAGVREASLNLLAPDPYPVGLPSSEALRMALLALREWFLDLVRRLGYDAAGIESVVLNFEFRPGDEYNSTVRATIVNADRKQYSGHVDFI